MGISKTTSFALLACGALLCGAEDAAPAGHHRHWHTHAPTPAPVVNWAKEAIKHIKPSQGWALSGNKDGLDIHHNLDGKSAADSGLTWAKGHLHAEMDTKFFCPKEFVPGRAGGFKSNKSRQACCMLDKSIAMMEIIYLARNCQKFEATKDSTFSNCYAGALKMVYWHLRACCVDLEFFEDKSERQCMSDIHSPLNTMRRDGDDELKALWGVCTGTIDANGDKVAPADIGAADRVACKQVEVKIVKYLLPRIHTAANDLYDKKDLTKAARKYLEIINMGTQKAVDKFLTENGGITNDGEPCLGARRRLSAARPSATLALDGHKLHQNRIPYGEPLCAHCEPHCPHTHLNNQDGHKIGDTD